MRKRKAAAKIGIKAFAMFSAALLCSCPQRGVEEPEKPFSGTDYFPLKLNSRWRYTTHQQTEPGGPIKTSYETRVIRRSIVFRFRTYFEVVKEEPGEKAKSYYYRVGSDGIHQWVPEDEEDVLCLPLPPTVWHEFGRQSPEHGSRINRVGSVVIDDKTYPDCVEVEAFGHTTSNGKILMKYYYAANVGFIRSTLTDGTFKMGSDLAEYTP